MMSCSTVKFVPEGEYLLEQVKLKSDCEDVHPSKVSDYIRIHPNSKVFSLFKVPLATYSLAGTDSASWTNRMLKSLGEKPVLYDARLVELTREDLTTAMQNMGYLHATTEVILHEEGKKRMSVEYLLHPGQAYLINSVRNEINDPKIASILQEDSSATLLKEGERFDIDILDAERKRITALLLDHGYYRFNKEFITYIADTVSSSHLVDLTMELALYQKDNASEATLHPSYRIGKIAYVAKEGDRLPLRQSVLQENTGFEEGQLFIESALQATYNNFARLQAIRYTNISFAEMDSLADGTGDLLCNINLEAAKQHTLRFQPEGTNTAGDLGAAVTLGYENRNLFRGSEAFSLEGRFAYERIRGLSGYDDHDFLEYSIEARLQFPRLIAPFLKTESIRRLNALSSELSLTFDMQNRPEFHRRVLSGGWHYNWLGRRRSSGNRVAYKFDVLNINFVSMPWISETFRKEYLESETTRNAILKYNYEDLFIMNLGFGFSYSTERNAYKASIETAGNILGAVSNLFDVRENSDGQYTPFGIAYAQYAKGDFDYVHKMPINRNITLVLHGGLGIAYPYGNATILPFEKRYFSGGANSVRGWSVRGLGPGKYQSNDGRINFINQTGDVKLDLNAELRTYLFWKFNGAFFIDAGNIWTLREYKDQPGGQLRMNRILDDIAASYGLGLRLNFDYFILRFDMAMKAINPVYDTPKEHFPVIHPDLGRDFTFHFAVGMPF